MIIKQYRYYYNKILSHSNLINKFLQNDYDGAVSDFTEAINSISNVPDIVFFGRGSAKYKLKDSDLSMEKTTCVIIG